MAFLSRQEVADALGCSLSWWKGKELVRTLVRAHIAVGLRAGLGAIWSQIGRDYCSIVSSSDGFGEDQAKQSWRSAGGRAFVDFVRLAIGSTLRHEGLHVLRRGELGEARGVRGCLTLHATRRCTGDSIGVWPENDLVVVDRPDGGAMTAVAVACCKTSLRERVMQSLFWSLALRTNGGPKWVFVTLDAQHELGTCAHPTKARKLVEAYFDRTYVLNSSAAFCAAVVSFDQLPHDLIQWRDE